MRYWWVNQNQTYKFEVPGGFLWSPKTKSDGGSNYSYQTMNEVRPGDLVFSYCETFIKAIGVVQQFAVNSPKPNFRNAGSNWSDNGWYVEIEFSELSEPFQPKKYMEQIRPMLPTKYSPLQENGNGNQGIYLTEISQKFGEFLILLSRADLPKIKNHLKPADINESEFEISLEIEAHKLSGDLNKIQMVKARRGQGIFKANVRMIENRCRVTDVTNTKHLRASHIKPWVVSNNIEKLDGFNGLLLSPHVDHLFDQGFISFSDGGDIYVSDQLNPKVLEKWSINSNKNVGEFRSEQRKYLDYHREEVFKK